MTEDPITLAELEWRIALLPPISRGIHFSGAPGGQLLAGPLVHAKRLIALWRVDDEDDVPLAEAFRVLDEMAVAGAILRTATYVCETTITDDHRHWAFPNLEQLMPELQATAWEAALDGTLQIEAVKGKQRVVVAPADLRRLHPEWPSACLVLRLAHGGDDEFVDARVRRAPIASVETDPKAKGARPTEAALREAAFAIAEAQPKGATITETTFLKALKDRLGAGVTREQARGALDQYAPHLKVPRGRRPKV
jgi:hypothetical protein